MVITDKEKHQKKNQTVLVFHRIVISSIFVHLLFKLFFLFPNFCQLIPENSQTLENRHLLHKTISSPTWHDCTI